MLRNTAQDVAENSKSFHRLIRAHAIVDRRIQTAIEHQLEALNILNRQLFILSVGPGYKFLPSSAEDNMVQFEKVD